MVMCSQVQSHLTVCHHPPNNEKVKTTYATFMVFNQLLLTRINLN